MTSTAPRSGADAQWQLKSLRPLDVTASEKLLALKNAQNGARRALQETAKQARGSFHTRWNVPCLSRVGFMTKLFLDMDDFSNTFQVSET